MPGNAGENTGTDAFSWCLPSSETIWRFSPLYTAKPIGIIGNRIAARSRAGCTMPDRPIPTVTGLLAELHPYRVQTMAPEALAANIDQRRLLEETADRDAFVKSGDVVEPFTRPEVLGGG